MNPDTRPLIVVVDDAPSMGKGLARVLESRGYRALVLTTAAEMMDWLEAARDATDPYPNAILIDIHLPDGSGLELARTARSFFGDSVPVVLLSGDTSMENLRALPEAGATLFLAKPVHIPRLLSQIEAWSHGVPVPPV